MEALTNSSAPKPEMPLPRIEQGGCSHIPVLEADSHLLVDKANQMPADGGNQRLFIPDGPFSNQNKADKSQETMKPVGNIEKYGLDDASRLAELTREFEAMLEPKL